DCRPARRMGLVALVVKSHEIGERIDATRDLDLDRHGPLLRDCPRPCTLYGPESRRCRETVTSPSLSSTMAPAPSLRPQKTLRNFPDRRRLLDNGCCAKTLAHEQHP